MPSLLSPGESLELNAPGDGKASGLQAFQVPILCPLSSGVILEGRETQVDAVKQAFQQGQGTKRPPKRLTREPPGRFCPKNILGLAQEFLG